MGQKKGTYNVETIQQAFLVLELTRSLSTVFSREMLFLPG